MDGVQPHLADESRTARFQAWLNNHPAVSLEMVAGYMDRSVKTVYMWKIGRPCEIPEFALRLLEQPVTPYLIKARARRAGGRP